MLTLGRPSVLFHNLIKGSPLYHNTKNMIENPSEWGVLWQGIPYCGWHVGLGGGEEVTRLVLGKGTHCHLIGHEGCV